MAGRKRALFLINSLIGGGAERVMCTLLRHSTAEREEFDIALALLDVEFQAYEPPDWVDLRRLDCGKSLPRSVLAVRKLMAEFKPDVTMSFLTRSNIANVLNARVPCVISERANTGAHQNDGLRGLVSQTSIRLLYPRATRVISVSDGVGQELVERYGVPRNRAVTIPNPVDADAIAAQAQQAPELDIGGPYVLGAGRLVKAKNFELLIRAFAQTGDTRKLVIIGQGPERDALQALAQECGIADRLILPGFIKNPYPLMKAADLFVLPSNSEGFPNALVEAMSLGVPVVSVNCRSGPSEVLAEAARETITGFTLAPHGIIIPPNDVAAMVEALRRMNDAELRRAYGLKAAARARAFSAMAAKDRYWAVIRDAMAERR